jgi:hypothetical protein
MRPIVVLLTDFGTRDHYVGAMKGAVLAVCPEATLVDLTHELPRHAVEDAAFCLAAACPAFPPGSVFVAVVDPGVGSARRALALEAGGRFFVGPDNGVFSLVLDEEPQARVRHVTHAALFRQPVSATFHGRDVFAPVAAHLARGLRFDQLGPEVGDPVRVRIAGVRQVAPGEWDAAIVAVDHFGNLTTSLTETRLAAVLAAIGAGAAPVVVRARGRRLPLVRTYADVGPGEICALVGSSGRLELAVNQGDAARVLALGRGDVVRLRLAGAPAPGGAA